MFSQDNKSELVGLNLFEHVKGRVLSAAEKYLIEEPVTITSFSSPRSAVGKHDFFSEGDYWWPDPANPDGPYIQKDGMTNPDNFVAHRKAMVSFSIQSATLTAAYKITHQKKFAVKAVEHFTAWFVNPETRMNPHLLYAQAIKGKFTGRGIGIIDAIHLIEVARSIKILGEANLIEQDELIIIKKWFKDFLEWMTTHKYGLDEMNAKNNHGTCWVMQVAAFSQLVGDEEKMEFCRKRFKEVLLPNQLALDGGFPLELSRTKPYNYSLFNLDAMATICQIFSTEKENLWNYSLSDGRNIRKALEFMYQFISAKSSWPYKQDVMFFEYYPVRQLALLFGGLAYNEKKFIDLWKTLNADPDNEE
ncbi:MAG: alginate lyase family protein, partial [Melioribacteraceae bacterium]